MADGLTRLYSLFSDRSLEQSLAACAGLSMGRFDSRRFPDGESYFRVQDNPAGLDVAILADLHQPDRRTLTLLLLAETLRDLGAARIVLVAPYLPYMRQDRRFQPGEGVTSRYFARLLSLYFDGLVTVDPHLHRYESLSEIYSIPTRVVAAAPALADWIEANVDNALLVGPDSESEQWVKAVAERAGIPFIVLNKVRQGDRRVVIEAPDLRSYVERTPVIIDDIISSGTTLLEAAKRLHDAGLPKAVFAGVHGVFSSSVADRLSRESARLIVTNTIPQPGDTIDVGGLLAGALKRL